MKETRFAVVVGILCALLSWPGPEQASGGGLAPCTNGSYTVAVSGVAGPACVSLHNRTYTMSKVGAASSSTYFQHGTFGCSLGRMGAGMQTSNGNRSADLYFNSPHPPMRCDALYHCAAFNCGTGGTFTLRGAYRGTWPATLTVSP